MIETLQTDSPKIVAFKLHGRLHDDDYRAFMPTIDAAVTTQGKVRLLAQFEDFHGWDLSAAWDDFKFGLKHYSDFERIAMIGDTRWEQFMAVMCKPFTRAKVRFFSPKETDVAWTWLREGIQPTTSA